MPGMTGLLGDVRQQGRVLASMRPRLNAGDDRAAHENDTAECTASMRPRLNAGDDIPAPCGIRATL